VGAAVHLGLEHYLRSGIGSIDYKGLDEYQKIIVDCMISGYRSRWPADEYEVLEVEKEFSTPLVNPDTSRESMTWVLSGKVDAIVRHRSTGEKYVMEHKTTSEDISPGSLYWKRLRMDGQISVYIEGARSLGHAVEGCIYDVLKKPSLRPLKSTPEADRKYKKDGSLYATQRAADETPEDFKSRIIESISSDPDKYYARGTVVRLASEMSEFNCDIWETSKQMHESERLGTHPRNPDACNAFGHLCEFFPICTGETTLEDTRYAKQDTANPELKESP
jgi:hypothetical protein